jgi:uncharacterized protein YktB (UPF0637 family)
MTEKEKLEIGKAKYSRLKNLTTQSGWGDLMEIITAEYNEALDILKKPKYAKQEIEARSIINFLDRFMTTLNSELEFGKVATEKYVKKYITPQLE